MLRKGLAVAVILLFIGMGIVPSSAVTEIKETSSISFDGNTLYVGGTGSNNYTTIQSAIDDAVDGDTVFVYDDSSPYVENIEISKSISLIGEDKHTTILKATDENEIIFVNDILINIKGFSFDSSVATYSVDVHLTSQASNCNISDNIFVENQDWGITTDIELKDAHNNIIYNNQFFGGDSYVAVCIDISGGSYNTISSNIIESFNGEGIKIDDHSEYNLICYNILFRCTEGIRIWHSKYNTITYNNFLNNSHIGLEFAIRANFNYIIYNNFINNRFNGDFSNFALFNYWDSNFWDDSQESPYIIEGLFFTYFIPWWNFDWNPAQEPYDI